MELLPPPTGREAIRVYAIGDVAMIKLPDGKALPKARVFAHAEAIRAAVIAPRRARTVPEADDDDVLLKGAA